MSPRARTVLLRIAAALLVGGCQASAGQSVVVGGDVERGKSAMAAFGCGSCHVIDGVRGAHGQVGPPLTGMGMRSMIAGQLPNTPDNLVRWLLDPPAVEPGTAMPALVADDQTARDMAAYLYTLR